VSRRPCWFLAALVLTLAGPARGEFTLNQLTESVAGGSPNFGPQIAAGGGILAFSSDRDLTGANSDANSEIFHWVDGTGLTQLTESTGCFSSDVGISDDGKRVVFNSTCDLVGQNADGSREVFLWTQGTALVQLTATSGGAGTYSPAISGDGHRVAFSSDADLTGNGSGPQAAVFLWVEGAGLSRLTNGAGETFDTEVDRDGRKVAFASDGDFVGQNSDRSVEVFVWSEGAGLKQLTKAAGGGSSRPSMSDDGSRIAFESDRNLTGENAALTEQIFLAQPSGLSQITHGPSTFTRMASLDGPGTAMAFSSDGNPLGTNASGIEQIFRWTPSGPLVQVTRSSGGSTRRPSIGNGGGRIAFDSNADLAGHNADHNTEIFLARQPAPAAPTQLAAQILGRRQVRLTWKDNARDETKYEVELRVGAQPFVLVATLGPNAKTFELKNLEPKTRYVARVRCRNAGGRSAPARVDFATPR
jgi:Tol biopolymer transport system component